MAFMRLLFISLLTYNTGFSAEIPVFVKTGDSVQLNIQTQGKTEFDDLLWMNDKSVLIVKYTNESKAVKRHSSYKERLEFNTETFSLTLKNMQESDSGVYTATAIKDSMNIIVTYRVSVIDAVEAPVLAVDSNWSSPDPCSFTCNASDIIISAVYNNSSCSPEEDSTSENYTLSLNCSGDRITCNHSNPVSWRTVTRTVNEICIVNQKIPKADFFHSAHRSWFIPLICVLPLSLLISLIVWRLHKRKKDGSYSPDQQDDEKTVYEQVGEKIKPESPLEKSMNLSTLYDTVREHPDVTVETNQTPSNHNSGNQSPTPTEKNQPNAPKTIYAIIQKQPQSETIYAQVNKQTNGTEPAHAKPDKDDKT